MLQGKHQDSIVTGDVESQTRLITRMFCFRRREGQQRDGNSAGLGLIHVIFVVFVRVRVIGFHQGDEFIHWRGMQSELSGHVHLRSGLVGGRGRCGAQAAVRRPPDARTYARDACSRHVPASAGQTPRISPGQSDCGCGTVQQPYQQGHAGHERDRPRSRPWSLSRPRSPASASRARYAVVLQHR